MYDDVESDFWKEIFVHLQHKNMVRSGAERLLLGDVSEVFQKFSLAHPELQPQSQVSGSSASWEIFITSTIKLRLFIQSGIKASLLQKKGADFVKIADAKFPYNPFPEISELLSNRNSYEREIFRLKEADEKSERKNKLAAEFIKAYAEEKIGKGLGATWQLEEKGDNFVLNIQSAVGDEIKMELSSEDFAEKIDGIYTVGLLH